MRMYEGRTSLEALKEKRSLLKEITYGILLSAAGYTAIALALLW